MSHTLTQPSSTIAPREATVSMSLDRLGSAFATRLSVMRCIVRRMRDEHWQVTRPVFDLDEQGYGQAVYTLSTPSHTYSLVAFSHYLDPNARTDRVIAEQWDSTFTLFDGTPDRDDIQRLSRQTPKQEAGRFSSKELVLSRVNKSVRLFNYVVEQLANGQQPDPAAIAEVGYLMRTTAVYGNGKFGMADRIDYADRDALAGPFRAELLAVYLIRCFCFDLIEHLATKKGRTTAVPLDPAIKRFIGIGNATGLGMAPFLISHPQLIHNWFQAREGALAQVRGVAHVTDNAKARFRQVLARAQRHVDEWCVDDALQMQRIQQLRKDLKQLIVWTESSARIWAEPLPWDALYRQAEATLSLEAQEMLVSLMFEPYPDLVDALADGLQVDDQIALDPTMTVRALTNLIDQHYPWVQQFNFDDPDAHQHFWYSSEEKLEPRRGNRYEEPGAGLEMPLAVARDISALRQTLSHASNESSVKDLLLSHPQHRHSAERVQRFAALRYAELHGNLLSHDCRPIDILRCKLAYFGAGKFDPKSDLWTRITMYQGAPLSTDFKNSEIDVDDWCWACIPERAIDSAA